METFGVKRYPIYGLVNLGSRDLVHIHEAVHPGKIYENSVIIRLGHINIGTQIKQVAYQVCQKITKTPDMGLYIHSVLFPVLSGVKTTSRAIERTQAFAIKTDIITSSLTI